MEKFDNKTACWFSGLWGISFLFHYRGQPADGLDELAYTSFPLMAMGLVLVFRPQTTGMLIAACGVHTLEVLIKAYLEVVHVSWFIHGTVSATLVATWLRHRGSVAEVLARCAPSIRAIVLVLYFYAVLHKLNAGYFSPEHYFPSGRIARIPLLEQIGPLEEHAAIIGLAMEVAIGVLLAIPRTRIVGAVLGGSFHGALGFTGYSQFAFLYPLYMLFLTPRAGEPLSRLWARWAPPQWRPWLLIGVVFVLSVERVLGITGFSVHQLVWLGLLVAGAASLTGYFLATKGHSKDEPAAQINFKWGPAALFVWCFLPYFGLVSHPCVAMYSELRVDSGKSNHYLVPAGLQLDAVHGDLARIESVSPKKYAVLFPSGREVPYRGLRHWVAQLEKLGRAPRRLVYTRNGERHTVRRGRFEDPSLWDQIPLLDYNYGLIVRNERSRLEAEKRRAKRSKRQKKSKRKARRRLPQRSQRH